MKTETAKKYFEMHKKLVSENQFNKKVEMNIEISKFKKENCIVLMGSEPLIEVFIGKGVDREFVGQIVWKYAKKSSKLECKHIGYDYTIKS